MKVALETSYTCSMVFAFYFFYIADATSSSLLFLAKHPKRRKLHFALTCPFCPLHSS